MPHAARLARRVGAQAIAAGRHFYTEKPLATSVADARELLDAAAAAGVLVGCAPDTFLGAGVQTLQAAIDDGRIGTPAVATIRLLHARPSAGIPSPAFLYAELSGPLLDVGPYTVSDGGRALRAGPAGHGAGHPRARDRPTARRRPSSRSSSPRACPRCSSTTRES